MEQIINDDRDLLWLIDKSNPSRKYALISVEETMVGVMVYDYDVTIINIKTGAQYDGSSTTPEDAIVNAIKQAQVGDTLIDQYGE